jgi:hypothetical protein
MDIFSASGNRLEEALLAGAGEALSGARRLVSGPVLRVRSGRLRGSFFARGESGARSAAVTLGNAAPYALMHEKGLAGRRARPFLRPAIEEQRERITALLENAFERRAGA